MKIEIAKNPEYGGISIFAYEWRDGHTYYLRPANPEHLQEPAALASKIEPFLIIRWEEAEQLMNLLYREGFRATEQKDEEARTHGTINALRKTTLSLIDCMKSVITGGQND